MSEDQCTAFVMTHKGQRLGWKICRDEIKDYFPSSRYFGLGPERPPREECVVEREVFSDWVKAEQWCAGFPPHPTEGGAEPRRDPPRLEDIEPFSGSASADTKALHARFRAAGRRAEALGRARAEAALEAAQATPATLSPCAVCGCDRQHAGSPRLNHFHEGTVSDRLKEARERAGLTVGQVGNLLSMRVSAIRGHESGTTTLDGDTHLLSFERYTEMYADLYGVSEAWLRGETVTVEPPPGIEKLPVDEQAKLMSLLESLG